MTDRSGRSSRPSPREWPQVRRSRLELAVVPAAVRIARVWTAEQLGRPSQGYERADADVIDSAVLVVSELVTNAIAAVGSGATSDPAIAAGQAIATGQADAAGQAAEGAAGPAWPGLGRAAAAALAGAAFARTAFADATLAATASAGLLLPAQILSFGDLHTGADLPGAQVPPWLAPRGPMLISPAPAPSPAPPSPAPPRVGLVIAMRTSIVRIEVHDSSRDPLPPARRSDEQDETGRGLMVVAALAKDWGWQPGPAGKVVWCELAG